MAFLGASLVAANAQAGNDDEVLIGTDSILMGGAVTALASDGSALWYNPAGLSGGKTHQVDVTGSAYTLRLWNIPEYLKGPGGTVADGNTYEAVVMPSAITYVRKLSERWTIGGGYFLTRWSDLRGHAELSFPDAGSMSTWQFGYVQTYSLHNVALGASFRQSEKFSVGGALIGMYNGFNFANELSGGIVSGVDSAFISSTEQGYQSHYGLQLQVGAVWSPLKQLLVGLSVRTPAVALYHSYAEQSYQTLGFEKDKVPELASDTTLPDRPLVYQTVDAEKSTWGADWLLPARIRLGVAHHIGDFVWSFDTDVQPPIRAKVVVVGNQEYQATNRHAVLNARLGMKRALSELVTLGGGLFTDRNGEKNDRLGVGRFNFYGMALGVEMGNLHQLAKTERTDKIRFSTVLGVRYAYGIGTFTTAEIPPFYELLDSALRGDASPDVETRATAHELTLNLGGGVYF